MADPGTVILATAGYISCAISLPPLVIQIQQHNLASSTLIICILTANVIYSTNAFIWISADFTSWWDGRIFCDIQVRLYVGLQVAVLGAASCVFRQLSLVFQPSLGPPAKGQKLRTKLVELMLCIVVPVLQMALVYVVQPDRYKIAWGYGCLLTVDTSWPTYVLIYLPILILSITGLLYAAITTIGMVRHRRNNASVLAQGQNRRNESRIIRLYSLGLILFLTAVPLQAYGLYYTLPRHLQPYSWSRIHPSDWSERIIIIPSTRLYGRANLGRWFYVFYSLCIAILVGLAPDAVESYKRWLVQFHVWRRCLGNKKSTPTRSSDCLPVQQGNRTQLRAMGRHELEALSIIRQDQEAV